MANKNLYYAWANNESGASLDVNSGGKETSISALENAARRELGSGWTVHIMRLDFANQDSTVAEGTTEVKKFTIR